MTGFAGQVALVTGASSGMGAATAKMLADGGARVFAAQRGPSEHEDIKTDFADPSAPEAVMGEVADRAGQLDILINNAALFTAAPIAEITRDDYTLVFDTHVSGTRFTMQALPRHMIHRGITGTIINMTHQARRRGEPLVAGY